MQILLFVFIFGGSYLLIKYLTRKKPIDTIEDHDGHIAFRVYQFGVSSFSVYGYNGYPKIAHFKTYADVVVYVETQVNGWLFAKKTL